MRHSEGLKMLVAPTLAEIDSFMEHTCNGQHELSPPTSSAITGSSHEPVDVVDILHY